MNAPKLTNAQHAELHELLEWLGAKRVWELRASGICGQVVIAHVSRCSKCSTLQDALLEAKLAELHPVKRERIEELGRCLASQFINTTFKQSGLLTK